MTEVKHVQFRSAYMEYLSSAVGTEMWVAFSVHGDSLQSEGFYVGKVIERNSREIVFAGDGRAVRMKGVVLFRANPDLLYQPLAFSLTTQDALDLLVNFYSVNN